MRTLASIGSSMTCRLVHNKGVVSKHDFCDSTGPVMDRVGRQARLTTASEVYTVSCAPHFYLWRQPWVAVHICLSPFDSNIGDVSGHKVPVVDCGSQQRVDQTGAAANVQTCDGALSCQTLTSAWLHWTPQERGHDQSCLQQDLGILQRWPAELGTIALHNANAQLLLSLNTCACT